MSLTLAGLSFDNVELNQNQFSNIVRVRYSDCDRLSFHSIISGSPNGSLILQISNDLVEDERLVVNWADYPDSLLNILGITQDVLNVSEISFRWVRMAYIFNSGDGFITTNFVMIKRSRH